jgi:hypothetical protein
MGASSQRAPFHFIHYFVKHIPFDSGSLVISLLNYGFTASQSKYGFIKLFISETATSTAGISTKLLVGVLRYSIFIGF